MTAIRVLWLLTAVTTLGGCATEVPHFDIPSNNDGYPTVATIKQKIVCELSTIALGDDLDTAVSKYYDVEVAVQLTLDVTQDGALAPSVSYMDGGFTLGTGFKLEQSREQNFTAQLFFSLSEIRKQADAPGWKEICSKPVDTNLSGNIGLKETFDLAMTTGNDLNWKSTGVNGVFGGYVTFIVKKDLTATGPTWTLRKFKGPGSFATLASDNNDKLFFAFSREKRGDDKDKAKAQAQNVIFINNLITTQLSVSLNSINQTLR